MILSGCHTFIPSICKTIILLYCHTLGQGISYLYVVAITISRNGTVQFVDFEGRHPEIAAGQNNTGRSKKPMHVCGS